MVLPGIPDGFPETAHSDHAQRSRVEETDRIPAADEGSHAHPPTPTASAGLRPSLSIFISELSLPLGLSRSTDRVTG